MDSRDGKNRPDDDVNKPNRSHVSGQRPSGVHMFNSQIEENPRKTCCAKTRKIWLLGTVMAVLITVSVLASGLVLASSHTEVSAQKNAPLASNNSSTLLLLSDNVERDPSTLDEFNFDNFTKLNTTSDLVAMASNNDNQAEALPTPEKLIGSNGNFIAYIPIPVESNEDDNYDDADEYYYDDQDYDRDHASSSDKPIGSRRLDFYFYEDDGEYSSSFDDDFFYDDRDHYKEKHDLPFLVPLMVLPEDKMDEFGRSEKFSSPDDDFDFSHQFMEDDNFIHVLNEDDPEDLSHFFEEDFSIDDPDEARKPIMPERPPNKIVKRPLFKIRPPVRRPQRPLPPRRRGPFPPRKPLPHSRLANPLPQGYRPPPPFPNLHRRPGPPYPGPPPRAPNKPLDDTKIHPSNHKEVYHPAPETDKTSKNANVIITEQLTEPPVNYLLPGSFQSVNMDEPKVLSISNDGQKTLSKRMGSPVEDKDTSTNVISRVPAPDHVLRRMGVGTRRSSLPNIGNRRMMNGPERGLHRNRIPRPLRRPLVPPPPRSQLRRLHNLRRNIGQRRSELSPEDIERLEVLKRERDIERFENLKREKEIELFESLKRERVSEESSNSGDNDDTKNYKDVQSIIDEEFQTEFDGFPPRPKDSMTYPPNIFKVGVPFLSSKESQQENKEDEYVDEYDDAHRDSGESDHRYLSVVRRPPPRHPGVNIPGVVHPPDSSSIQDILNKVDGNSPMIIRRLKSRRRVPIQRYGQSYDDNDDENDSKRYRQFEYRKRVPTSSGERLRRNRRPSGHYRERYPLFPENQIYNPETGSDDEKRVIPPVSDGYEYAGDHPNTYSNEDDIFGNAMFPPPPPLGEPEENSFESKKGVSGPDSNYGRNVHRVTPGQDGVMMKVKNLSQRIPSGPPGYQYTEPKYREPVGTSLKRDPPRGVGQSGQRPNGYDGPNGYRLNSPNSNPETPYPHSHDYQEYSDDVESYTSYEQKKPVFNAKKKTKLNYNLTPNNELDNQSDYLDYEDVESNVEDDEVETLYYDENGKLIGSVPPGGKPLFETLPGDSDGDSGFRLPPANVPNGRNPNSYIFKEPTRTTESPIAPSPGPPYGVNFPPFHVNDGSGEDGFINFPGYKPSSPTKPTSGYESGFTPFNNYNFGKPFGNNNDDVLIYDAQRPDGPDYTSGETGSKDKGHVNIGLDVYPMGKDGIEDKRTKLSPHKHKVMLHLNLYSKTLDQDNLGDEEDIGNISQFFGSRTSSEMRDKQEYSNSKELGQTDEEAYNSPGYPAYLPNQFNYNARYQVQNNDNTKLPNPLVGNIDPIKLLKILVDNSDNSKEHHAQPSNLDAQIRKPDLQDPVVFEKITKGEPWYAPHASSAENSQKEVTAREKQKNEKSPNSETVKPPFRSDIKMIKRANITAPNGNNTNGDQEYEYFYYYYYDYIYPDELEDTSFGEPLPSPVPLTNEKDASQSEGDSKVDGISKEPKASVKRRVTVKKNKDGSQVVPVSSESVVINNDKSS